MRIISQGMSNTRFVDRPLTVVLEKFAAVAISFSYTITGYFTRRILHTAAFRE